MATLEMFKSGAFSSNESNPHQVDAYGLRKVNIAVLARGLQVSETNPIAGLEGRVGLLERLSGALRNQGYFGRQGRPGGMLGASHLPLLLIHSLHPIQPTSNSTLRNMITSANTGGCQTTSSPTQPLAPPPSP